MTNWPRHGFTLIELSIVLVIIGLIVGGVLAGRDLIRSAELRSIVADVEKIVTAVNAYKTKYNALPGDDRMATDVWGTMSGGCVPPGGGTGTQTCNGNGNGIMDNWYGNGGSTAATNAELFLFWQHLANAELLKGRYTGVTGPGYWIDILPGTNVMASVLSPRLAYFALNGNAGTYIPPPAPNNTITFGAMQAGAAPTNYLNPALRPVEALSLDQKVDDGRPGTGRMTANWQMGSGICSTNFGAPLTSLYNTATQTVACTTHFVRQF